MTTTPADLLAAAEYFTSRQSCECDHEVGITNCIGCDIDRMARHILATVHADDDEPCDMAWIAEVIDGFKIADCWEMGRTFPVKDASDVCVSCLRCGKDGPLKVAIEAFADHSLNLKQVVLYNPTRGKFRMACRLIDVDLFKKNVEAK